MKKPRSRQEDFTKGSLVLVNKMGDVAFLMVTGSGREEVERSTIGTSNVFATSTSVGGLHTDLRVLQTQLQAVVCVRLKR